MPQHEAVLKRFRLSKVDDVLHLTYNQKKDSA